MSTPRRTDGVGSSWIGKWNIRKTKVAGETRWCDSSEDLTFVRFWIRVPDVTRYGLQE